ncbi:MAG: hypothetical protein H6739_26600 [Alphaproteobacteria bacterium]|nr:hypothetical protein [Alphaproteobacteria bacterium]
MEPDVGRASPLGVAVLAALAGCTGKGDAPELTLHIAQGAVTAASPDLGAAPGLVGVPNLDDDDGDGVADWETPGLSGDNDLSVLEVDLGPWPARLTLSGDTEHLMVLQDGKVILGGVEGPTEARLNRGEVDDDAVVTHTLQVMYGDFLARGTLTVTEIADEGEDADTVSLALTGAPLILNHHLQPAEHVWAISTPQYNRDFINVYQDTLGDAFTPISGVQYDYDPWLQDEFEFATLSAPDAFMGFIIDSIRNGQGRPGDGLDDVAEDLWVEPDMAIGSWGQGRANSFDYFGNLEVSPPVTVDGVVYPFGRVYYGAEGRYAPKQEMRDMLDAQVVQAPFFYTTAWLTVGHVDEFQSTVPFPSSERGWKWVVNDTNAAWDLLEQMDPDTPLTRYALPSSNYQGHDIDTVGEMLEDQALRALNDDLQRDYLDPAIETFKAELGLTDDDIIRMPGLFEETGFGGVAALIPGMANLIVADVGDGNTYLFMADPFLRTNASDQSADPMITYVRALFPDTEVVFLDDWALYHMNLGEVHCGSNVRRTQTEDWWTAAAHLLEDSE